MGLDKWRRFNLPMDKCSCLHSARSLRLIPDNKTRPYNIEFDGLLGTQKSRWESMVSWWRNELGSEWSGGPYIRNIINALIFIQGCDVGSRG